MMLVNESPFDRAIRILFAIALAIAGWIAWPGALAGAVFVIAAILCVTSCVGWCPAYKAFGISTNKTTAA